MNKHLIIIALCGLMGLAFASCSRPSIVGTWVEPAAEGSLLGDVGFTLLAQASFADTNNIISLDENQLVIGQDGYSVTYQRR